MARVLALLVVAVAFAGCTNPPESSVVSASTASSTQDPSADANARTTPVTTTQSTPTRPPPTPTASTPPTSGTPTSTPTPTPTTPAPRPNYSDARSGWVTPPQSAPTAFTAKLTFFVNEGGNVTARSSVTTITAPGAPAVSTPKVVNLTLLDPEGKVAYWQSRQHTVDVTNETLQSNGTLRPGEWSLVYTIQGGASDGATAGDRYSMSILVRY